MIMMASSAFHAGHSEVAEIQTAYHTLTPLLGAGAASVFLISLMASGISSSTVGTMAGQIIMQGFDLQMPGAYAEYATCMAALATKVPKDLSDEDAAMIEPMAVGRIADWMDAILH